MFRAIMFKICLLPTTLSILLVLFHSSGLHFPAQSIEVDDKESEFYQPLIKDIEGWSVKVDPTLLEKENREVGERALKALANHLQRVTFVLSREKVKQLQQIPIWIEQAGRGRGLVYHPSSKWLEQNGFNPEMARHVHIPRPEHLLAQHQWTKHPYAIMHELAHAYHDQILGWDDTEIKGAFEQAKKLGIYKEVLSHNHQTVEHYGLNNHKEYFAESTEAYVGVNDFYPFVRAELKEHDPRMFKLLKTIWGELP